MLLASSRALSTHSSVSQMLKSENPTLRCPSWRLSRHSLPVGGTGRRWECARWEKPLSDSAFSGHSDISGSPPPQASWDPGLPTGQQQWHSCELLQWSWQWWQRGLQAPAAPVGTCLCREDWKGLALVFMGGRVENRVAKKGCGWPWRNLTTRRRAVPSVS